MSTKRIILANGPQLLREMLHSIIDRADQLEVVKDIPDYAGLPSALKRFDPDWVIVPQSEGNPLHQQIEFCMKRFPSVRFVFFSPDQNNIKMRWQMSYEAEYPDLSLKEFIHRLKQDLQHA